LYDVREELDDFIMVKKKKKKERFTLLDEEC